MLIIENTTTPTPIAIPAIAPPGILFEGGTTFTAEVYEISSRNDNILRLHTVITVVIVGGNEPVGLNGTVNLADQL